MSDKNSAQTPEEQARVVYVDEKPYGLLIEERSIQHGKEGNYNYVADHCFETGCPYSTMGNKGCMWMTFSASSAGHCDFREGAGGRIVCRNKDVAREEVGEQL